MRGQLNLWQCPPANVRLNDDEIHIWRAVLDASPRCIEALRLTLPHEEVVRANRFCFPRDRDQFILTRGLLRALLAGYTGLEPTSLRFLSGPYGKPALATDTVQQTLRFNVSHTGGVALFALSRFREVGVDVELVRPDFDWAQISGLFAPRENAFLHTLAEGAQAEAFFRLWTRKEAYAKARGLGLAIPLDQLDLSLPTEEPTLLVLAGEEQPGATSWSLRELTLNEGYVAALAVEGDLRLLTCRQYFLDLEAFYPLLHGHMRLVADGDK